MSSPFQFGKIVTGRQFLNRKDEIQRLHHNWRSGVNSVVISPRRWGKTSLVQTAIERFNSDRKTVFIHVDLMRVRSEEEFYELLAREVLRGSVGRMEEIFSAAKEYLTHLIPEFNFGLDPMNDFSVSFRYRNIRRDSNEILDLAETLAAKKKLRLVICFDEFQNITQFRKADNIEDHLRSVWQNHQHVTYTLYGSKRTILTDIFENSGRPFFRFGDIILLDKIPAEDWYPYLQRHFSNSGKKLAAEAARRIVAEVEGHTYYVQQLAHEVWLHGSDHVWEKDVEEAMATLVERNSPLYENQLDHLSATQVNLIKAAAAGIKQFTSVKTMRDYRLGTPNNVRQNKAVLEREEIIEFERRGGEFLDPVFLRWFREIYQIKPANKDEDY